MNDLFAVQTSNMAAENNTDKGKERERDSPVPDPNDPRTKNKWFGRFHEGAWYCHCEDGERKAICLTIARPNHPNYGEKFWICPKPKDRQCAFFLLVKDTPQAKTWLSSFGSPPRPQLPDPRSPETPWSIAKRCKRKPVSRENSGESGNGEGPSGLRRGEEDEEEEEGEESPTRKIARRTRSENPGPSFRERLESARSTAANGNGLPTPTTISRPAILTPSSSAEAQDPSSTSLTPTRTMTLQHSSTRLQHAIDLTSSPSPSPPPSPTEQIDTTLSTSILSILKEDGTQIREWTEMRIKEEIDTEVQVFILRARRDERVIRELRERISRIEGEKRGLKEMLDELTGEVVFTP